MRYIFILIFLGINILLAQNEVGNWNAYFGGINLNDKITFHNEIQLRNNNFKGDFNQLLLRGGVGYNFTPNNNNLLLGYGFILSKPQLLNGKPNEDFVKEHRVFQQFITKNKVNRVNFLHRYRFEQRFIEDQFQLRFRYFLAIHIPFNNPQIIKNTWYFANYNEIFLKLEDSIFDQNRLSGAIGYAPSKNLKIELGALIQFFEQSYMTHLQIAFFNTLSFNKKDNL